MERNRLYENRRWIKLAVVLLILAAGAFATLQTTAARVPEISEFDLEVGTHGPFEIPFDRAMQTDSVLQRIEVSPPIDGKFNWEGNTVQYWPSELLETDTTYQIILHKGARGAGGWAILRDASWNYKVREPSIVYLHPVSKPELWIQDSLGGTKRQLTDTGGRVYDLGPAADGNRVVLSVVNDEGGIDLWLYSRKTDLLKILMDCGRDWCTNPSWSPSEDLIAYTRRPIGGDPAGPPGTPAVHILEYPSLIDRRLLDDETRNTHYPKWSPDGQRLAFFDASSGGIQIYDLVDQGGTVLQTRSGLMGSWSADSRKFGFVHYQNAYTGLAYASLYLFDPGKQTLEKYPFEGDERMDIGVPSWSPDGQWMAAALQPAGQTASKQIWLLPVEGGKRVEITSDEQYIHTGHSFSPDGKWLLYQRISLSGSQARPELMLWNLENNTAQMVCSDATLPYWLP